MNLDKFEELYQCFNRKSSGIIGRSEEWMILKGSRIADDDTCSYAKNGRTKRLIEEGYIQNNIFVKDYPIKSKTSGVTIIGRHGVSNIDAEKKSCRVSVEEAESILNNNFNVSSQNGIDVSAGKNSSDKPGVLNQRLGLDAYEELITDATFQKLKYLQSEINIFTIVGQTHTEHWHSSFFKWLFQPFSSLELGSFPLERLLYLYILKKENGCISYDDIENLKLDEIEFRTEKTITNPDFSQWNQGSIDVYGVSDELVIVIENKVTAKETVRDNVGQTEVYFDYIEKHKSEGQKSIYLFITPDPMQQPRCREYVQITYQELYDSIISKCIMNPQIKQAGKYVLEQYSGNLSMPYKKDEKQYPMALIHIPLCEKIYEIHAEALDAIFSCVERKNVNSLEFSIYKRYKEVFDELFMSVEKYGRTPDSQIERKIVTFDNLVKEGKLSEHAQLYMNYDGVTYYAKLLKNSEQNEWCMALLDENKNLYTDEYGQLLEQYCTYRTPSRAAGDAVYLYRSQRGDLREKPSLNGRDYWTVCDDNIKLSKLMS